MKKLILITLSLTLSCGQPPGGKDGKQGATGPMGLTGPQGQPGATGATGETGSQGANGQTGPAGTNGLPGTTGPMGADGTTILPIQFCPNLISSYPSSFPEVGLLINGKIYAVFSTNGQAGLVALLPGSYITTTTGLPCSFTILPNGTIQ